MVRDGFVKPWVQRVLGRWRAGMLKFLAQLNYSGQLECRYPTPFGLEV